MANRRDVVDKQLPPNRLSGSADVVHLVQDMGQPQHTRNNPYALPSNNPGAYTPESTAIAGLIPSNPFAQMNFLRGEVPDTLNSSANANIRLTTESLFDYFLGEKRTYPSCGEWSREAVS